MIIGGSTVLGSKGAYDVFGAGRRAYQAKKRYAARRKKYVKQERAFKRELKIVNAKIDTLGKRRLQALATLGKAAALLKKAKVRDRGLSRTLDITIEQFEEWEGAAAYATDVLSGVVGSAGAGTATAAAAQGMVGSLAAASTGTPIAALKGVAATKATLAWFGGGSLAAGGGGMALGAVALNALIAGPAILAAGFFAQRKAEKIDTDVAKHIADMDIAEEKTKTAMSSFGATRLRVDELMQATEEADKALQHVLSEADTDSMKDLYTVARAAKQLGKVVDVPVINDIG